MYMLYMISPFNIHTKGGESNKIVLSKAINYLFNKCSDLFPLSWLFICSKDHAHPPNNLPRCWVVIHCEYLWIHLPDCALLGPPVTLPKTKHSLRLRGLSYLYPSIYKTINLTKSLTYLKTLHSWHLQGEFQSFLIFHLLRRFLRHFS